MDDPEDDPDGEPVVIPLTGEIDLHFFPARDVVSAAEEYVTACHERGLTRLRLVHGRGRGVQRAAVRRMLESHPAVDSFADAPPDAGGWGATLVRLRPRARVK